MVEYVTCEVLMVRTVLAPGLPPSDILGLRTLGTTIATASRIATATAAANNDFLNLVIPLSSVGTDSHWKFAEYL
jgi:hypothetical protein